MSDNTWNLDFNRDPARIVRLTELNREVMTRFDGTNPLWPGYYLRRVLAGARFRGGPGREQEAAEAWTFELKTYFHRGVGEQPEISYAQGVYTVVGLIQTTHPGDVPGADGIVWFT